MSTALLYQRPVALSRDAHRRLRLVASKASFSYAALTNCVPLACSEFSAAASDYPIVFSEDAKEERLPVALLGMRDGENLFVSSEGAWQGAYIPAFVRRYPFLLAARERPEDFTVCVDEAYAAFSSGDDGEPLFLSDGADAPALKQAIEFLNSFHAELRRTKAFMERLRALDLLIPRVVHMTSTNGSKFLLQGFMVVDEKRLETLDERLLGELMRTGYLRCIYAHLLSLGNVARLSSRLEARLGSGTASTA